MAKFAKGRVANPRGTTGRRGVHYVSPGHTRVIYEDRVMDIRFKETPLEFGKKITSKDVRENNMAYIDDATAKKYGDMYYDSVERHRSKGAKKGAKQAVKTRRANVAKAKAELKEAGIRVPKSATQKSIREARSRMSADMDLADVKAVFNKGKKSTKRRSSPKAKSGAPQSIDDFPVEKSKSSKRKSQFQRDCEFLRNEGFPLTYPLGGNYVFNEKDKNDVMYVRDAVRTLKGERIGMVKVESGGIHVY